MKAHARHRPTTYLPIGSQHRETCRECDQPWPCRRQRVGIVLGEAAEVAPWMFAGMLVGSLFVLALLMQYWGIQEQAEPGQQYADPLLPCLFITSMTGMPLGGLVGLFLAPRGR